MLIYDIEIVKAIPDRNGERLPDINYCEGWDDKASMGVSVICAYDITDDRYRVFTKECFKDFEELASENLLIGFNSIHFDDEVLKHEGINVRTQYDLLQELWVAAGLGRDFQYPSHAGFGLNATAQANEMGNKTGWGGYAPVQWQRGEYGSVIDYCLEDVRLTWHLVRQVLDVGALRDPRSPDKWLNLEVPILRE